MNKNFTSVRLEITSKCNLHCAYCHNEKYINSNDDKSTDELIKLITNLKKSNNINKVLLTGGEPLMNKDVIKLVKTFTELGIKVDMVSNGILLTEKMMKELDDAGLKRIRLSIDDTTEKNINRDNVNSSIILKKIRKIVDNTNIQVCVHTVATPDNVDDLFDLYKTVLNSGAKRWRVFDVGYQGGIISNKDDFNLSNYYEKLVKVSRKIIKHYIKYNHIDDLDIEINNIFKTSFLKMNIDDYKDFEYKKEYDKIMNLSPCNYVTNHQLTIRSNGDATLCQYFRNPISKTTDGNLVDCENNPEENKVLLKDIEACKNCKYVLNCKSGCRSRALYFNNDITTPDPTVCVLHPLVSKYIISALPKNIQYIYNLYINENGKKPKYTKRSLDKLMKEKGFENE